VNKDQFPATGLAFKIIFFISLSITGIFLVIFIYNYNVTRTIIENNIESNAENLAYNKINQVEKVLISVEKVPENIVGLLEKTKFNEADLIRILKTIVEKNSEIYGAAIAFEPKAFDNREYFAPYVYRDSGKLKVTSLANENYKYLNTEWYTGPKNLGTSVWSEPYYDDGGGNTIMSTYSVPIFRERGGEKIFVGVITADISLEWLDNIISSIKILESGYGFLISRNGNLITHPIKEKIMHETIFSLAKSMKSPLLEKTGHAMINGKSGFDKISYIDIANGKLSWIYYAPVPHNGWSLAVVYPIEELTAGLDSLNSRIMLMGAIGFFIIIAVIVVISKSITKPLTKLTIATDKFAKGEMDISLPEAKSNDEIAHLTRSFIYMRDELKIRMKELQIAYQELWTSKEKLEEYNKSLEEKVSERTKEILIEAKELSELKSRFISMISHELRTPLYTISSSAEILEMYGHRINDNDKLEQFKKIQNAINDILELLNEVISINKSDIGKVNLNFETFDIAELLREILGQITLRFERMPGIKINVMNDQLLICSDRREVSHIISNLLINAVKYTPSGKGINVYLSKDKENFIIEVKDEGIGIPEKDKENLFEVFTRGSNVSSINGHGLGLAITKRSVDILGGSIKFRSKEGTGSVFIVRLPAGSQVANSEKVLQELG
jgi:signal transduction histidine kinase